MSFVITNPLFVSSAEYLVSEGCPKHKLIIGIPTYGRSWTPSSNNTGLNATAIMGGHLGPLTTKKGLLAYSEICQFIQNDGWSKVTDEKNHMGPYAFKVSFFLSIC